MHPHVAMNVRDNGATVASSSTTALVVCTECTREIDGNSDQCRLSCGHQFHLRCYLRLYVVHNIARCFVCIPSSVPQSSDTNMMTMPLDLGDDANVRRMIQEAVVNSTSLMTRATHTEHQQHLPPVETQNSNVFALNAMSAIASAVPILAPITQVVSQRVQLQAPTFDQTNTSKEQVFDMLRRGLPSRELKRAGVTIDHVIGAGVNWRQWQSLGYNVEDAVKLGARWRNLMDMRFDQGILRENPLDYHLIGLNPLNVSFPQFMQDAFDNNYELLSKLQLSAVVLAALGMDWDTLLHHHVLKHEDLLFFSYLSLADICLWLRLKRETFLREKFTLDFLARMKWTVERMSEHLHINRSDLDTLYGSATVIVPARSMAHIPIR